MGKYISTVKFPELKEQYITIKKNCLNVITSIQLLSKICIENCPIITT